MTKKVDGFLAEDGTFFSTMCECDRYEHERAIRTMCESHNVNANNFLAMLNEWSKDIRGYYHADSQCEQKRAEATGSLSFSEPTEGSLSHPEVDNEDVTVGVEDLEGLLQFETRKRVGVPDFRNGPQPEAVRPARPRDGS